MSLDNMKPLLIERAELKFAKDALDARIKELDKEIKPALADEGKYIVNGYSLEVKMRAGRKTLDQKAMEADGIDLEPYRKEGAPSAAMYIERVNQI